MSSRSIRNIHVKSETMLVFLLAAVQFTHILDFVIMMPLGTYFQEAFHINPREFSFLISAYTYSAFIAGIVGAFFIDRFDRKSAAIFLYAGFIAGTTFCAIADSYFFLLIARIISGAFGGILSSVVFAIVGDVIAMDRRGRATGAIMGAFSVASVIGIPLGLKVAEYYGWNMSFAGIVLLSLPILVLMNYHLPNIPPFQSAEVDPIWNFVRILTYRKYIASYMLIMFVILGGFTVIPFIAPYMERNVGILKDDIPWIYFFGGLVTFFSSRMIGIVSDKIGKHKVFYILVSLSFIPIFIMTNLGQTSLVNVLILTTVFMVVVSGRWIPALALITSATEPSDRGRFMTVISALQNLASGLGATIGGSILVAAASPTAPYQNYEVAGYLAMGFNVIALVLISKVKTVS